MHALYQIKSKEGYILTNNEGIVGRWKQYFNELLAENTKNNQINTPEPISTVANTVQLNDDKVMRIRKYEEIRKEELNQVIKKIKLGKAVGHDKIATEFTKYIEKTREEMLRDVINLS